MADDQHYIFDFASTETTNRFSIYKDGRGYMSFSVFNNGNDIPSNQRSNFKVSADIASWKAGEKHHVATSWKINTSERQDEMHLFIDGFEVPNIIRYGGRPIATSTDRFSTVKPEIVAGTLLKNARTAADLHTTSGSTSVFSDSVNFATEGILPGDIIDIL